MGGRLHAARPRNPGRTNRERETRMNATTSSDGGEPRHSRLMRRLRWAQWIIIPAAFFGLLEWAVRRAERQQTLPIGWNWPEIRSLPSASLDFVFIGSSRVGGSIDVGTFEHGLSQRLNQPVKAVNLGHGWSYLLQNYLWLRNLHRERPELLRGAIVVAEAPGGAPAFECQRWHDRWFEPGMEYQLISLLRAEDLPRMWASGMTLSEKFGLSFGLLGRPSEFILRRAAVGHFLRSRAEAAAIACLASLVKSPPAEAAPQLEDLPKNLGIRTDAEAVERNRRLATMITGHLSQADPPAAPEERIINDLARLLQETGGRLVFFVTPQHSLYVTRYQAEEWQARRRAFAARMEQWDAPILSVDFHAPDEDFPDIVHLRQSRAADFTSALLQRLVEADVRGETQAAVQARLKSQPVGAETSLHR